MRDEKISLQHANINDNELEVIFAQTKYRNPVIASGRALNILDQIAPNNIKNNDKIIQSLYTNNLIGNNNSDISIQKDRKQGES